jgi:hypothetical protein
MAEGTRQDDKEERRRSPRVLNKVLTAGTVMLRSEARSDVSVA